MTKFVNLNPHELRIRLDESTVAEPLDTDIVIPETKPACRISQTSIVVEPIDGLPVKKTVFGTIENLPEPEFDTVYLVSMLVAQNAHRSDVVSPDTSPAGGAVRVSNGQIFAVRGFQQFD